jgi:putative ABC transport system ATP-binding protein
MLAIRNVSKKYKKGNAVYTALEDVSIEIKKGDFCTIVGPSGAGKSTLLHVIGGLVRPDSGEVIFNGSDINKYKEKEKDLYRKKYIGFMFQQFHLMPYLSVYENIRLACFLKEQIDRIDYFTGKCSLDDLKNKLPEALSVGEKQRTAFIRAIVSDPEILLADEPTGNLDPANSDILTSLFKDYNSTGGTVVIVTHNIAIAKYSNRHYSLNRGNLVSE